MTNGRLNVGAIRSFGAVLALAMAVPASAQAAGAPAPQGDTLTPPPAARQEPAPPSSPLALHVQGTFVVQSNGAFRSDFSGPNSLHENGETRETADVTLYAGIRPWSGAELWINPELDQGFGLANTLGAAGFPSGEAYKVGKAHPYTRLQRLFLRNTIGLGGGAEKVEADLNQFEGMRDINRLVLTVGKFSVGDVFDTNAYAHDPRVDFLNWTLIDSGAFDYAADAWGYSTGGAAELYAGRVALRARLFNLSRVPNSTELEPWFRQYELVGEVEERHAMGGREGKMKLTVFANHGRMALLDEAVAHAAGGTPDPELVRRFATRLGGSLNLEQSLGRDLGLLARASFADGRYETYEFTDVDRSVSAGLSMKGALRGQPDDRVGLGIVVNHASPVRMRYLAAGGLGILVGDGALPRPGDEQAGELFYDLAIAKFFYLTGDLQVLNHPAYNRERGPVTVLGARLHAQY